MTADLVDSGPARRVLKLRQERRRRCSRMWILGRGKEGGESCDGGLKARK